MKSSTKTRLSIKPNGRGRHETLASILCSKVLNRQISALYRGNECPSRDNRWIFLQTSSGNLLAFNIAGQFLKTELDYFRFLVRLSYMSREVMGDPDITPLDCGFGWPASGVERYSLYEYREQIPYPLCDVLLAIEEDPFSDVKEYTDELAKDLAIASLEIFCKSKELPPDCSDSCMRTTMFIKSPCGAIYVFNIKSQSSNTFLGIIEEVSMADIEKTFPISVYLGNMELNLSELLKLRTGSELSLAIPQTLKGTLNLGKGELAKVDIKFEANELFLTINEVFSPKSSNFQSDIAISS